MRRLALLLLVVGCLVFWASPFNLAAQPGDAASPNTIRVFPLAHASAGDVRNQLGYIAETQGVTVTVDDRSNSLILAGDQEAIEAILVTSQALDSAPRTIATDIAIYELHGEAAQQELTPDMLASAEDVRMIRRIRLQMLENNPTSIQLGEMVPVKVGENFPPGRGSPQAMYQVETLGTLVNCTARVTGDSITMELMIESTRLQQPEGDDAEALYPGKTTGQLQTTVALAPGAAKIVGDFTSTDSPADTRFVVLVTASLP